MIDTYVPKEVSSAIELIDTYKRHVHFSQKGLRSYKHYHPSEMGKCLRSQQYKHYAHLGYIDVELVSNFDREKGWNFANCIEMSVTYYYRSTSVLL